MTATNAACKPWRRLDIWRSLTLSSSGLGHRPFTAVTRVRIPLGSHHSLNDLRSRLAKIRTDSTISDVLDVLHERPSTRIEKNSPSPIKFFARIEGFSFGRFAFCRNYDAARMRIIQVRPFGAVAGCIGCIVAIFIKRRRQLHSKDENGSK